MFITDVKHNYWPVAQLEGACCAERQLHDATERTVTRVHLMQVLTLGITSIVVVRMESSCMAVGLYTKCLAGFSIGALEPANAPKLKL